MRFSLYQPSGRSLVHSFTGTLKWAGVASIFCLGLMTARLISLPLGRMHQLLGNPFGFSTRVAPSGPTVLAEVQRLQRLETCRYNGQSIVRGNTEGILPVALAGDRILFIGRGEVVAGIDLSNMKPEDVRVRDDAVTLRLPEPQILHTRLDNKQSEVFERETGIFSRPDRDLETKVRVEAEERIRQAALDSGVLDTARANAQDTLRRQMTLLGFNHVTFLPGG